MPKKVYIETSIVSYSNIHPLLYLSSEG